MFDPVIYINQSLLSVGLTIAECVIIYSVFVYFQYNSVFEVAVSLDGGGMIEYWTGPNTDYQFPKQVQWSYKMDTDLYEFVKVFDIISFNLVF